MATAIDQRADLSPYLVRQFSELSREFGGQNLVRGNPPGVDLFYAAKLIRLEACGVSYYILDGSCPPDPQLVNTRAESGQLPERSAIGFGLKLQEE